MSGSVVKKALPVLLVLLVIIVIGAIVTCANTGEKVTPSVSDAEKVYLSIEEDGLTYSVTRGEIYEELKLSYGSNSLINYVNKTILKVEKNSDGVSFFDAVLDADITEEIDTAVYGEDAKDDLTEEEKEEKEQDFLDSMFSAYGYKETEIYGASIWEHYQLILAKELYAKAQLEKAIAEQDAKAENDDDEDPYYDEDEIDDYYSDNYYKEYWGIIIPFVTKDEAENALQQLGVAIDTDKDAWVKVEVVEEKDANDNGTGIYTTELGEALTPAEVVDTFIKLYNLVYGYKSESGLMITEGTDYTVLDVTAEVEKLEELADYLVTILEAEEDSETATKVSETVTAIESAIAALETKFTDLDYSTAALTSSLKTFTATLEKYNTNEDADEKENLKNDVVDDAKAFKANVAELNKVGYIFDTTVEDSVLHYDNERLSDYNSTLPNKFNNTYKTYLPFATESEDGSTNVKPSWYTDELLGLSSNSYYVFVLEIAEVAIPELEDVKAEIIEKLKEEELTSNYIETKMAQLRENYGLVIYDEKVESQYNASMESYGIEREATEEESSDKVAQFTQYTYTKADVSSKKEFKSVRKDNDGIFVYNNGIYEEVKKYNEDETYYVREAGTVTTISTDDLFKEMDKAYGASVAISEITYQRFLYNKAFNVYKDMNTGEWIDEDKREEFLEEIENLRLNFLAGGYTSYGYDPTSMTWVEFMGQLYGATDVQELAHTLLYSDILADYTQTLVYLTEVDDEGKLVNTNYQELLNSEAWALYQEKMEEVLEEYFSVEGIHFLVSRYEDPADSTSSGTPINPEEWTEEQKELAKELIADVVKYLQVGKGDFATVLTEISDAFAAAPLYVNGEAPVIYDDNGNEVEYTLTKAEVTIDVAKYKTAGLYVKYEDLDSFTNGTMVEAFNDAVKAIWDKDVADEVYDRVTVLEEPIETEFGYHLYINLASHEVATYESNEIKVNEDGTWEYVYVDEEKTEHKTIETVFPQLYEILLSVEGDEDGELSSGAQTAIETYYEPLSTEVTNTYFTYICQYVDLVALLTDTSLTDQASYSKEDLDRVIQLNIDSWYENNFTYFVSGDEEVVRGNK